MTATVFSEVEKEVFFLLAVKELIDSMVNFENMELRDSGQISEIRFHSAVHQRYFNIILVDFLSATDQRVIGVQQSYLGAIQSICKAPNFNHENSIDGLVAATKGFVTWLEQEVKVETHLPSIDTNMVLSIRRVEFLKICGNISKHHFSRLSVTANELLGILKRNGVVIDLEKALLALEDFNERFHDDILNYHGCTISEFLNNIRWSIHEYLLPEFSWSIVYEGGSSPLYSYTYPIGVTNEFALRCYWGLMNEIRSRPYMKKFKAPDYLKIRY